MEYKAPEKIKKKPGMYEDNRKDASGIPQELTTPLPPQIQKYKSERPCFVEKAQGRRASLEINSSGYSS